MLPSPRTKPFGRIPLPIVLIVPFVIQVVLVVGLVGYLSFRNGQQAVNNVAHQLRAEINARIEEHLSTFLDTPYRINQINANALRQGWLDAGNQATLERYLWQQVQIFPSVTSIYFGNTEGGVVDAGREGPTGSLYVIVTDDFASGPFRKYATDMVGNRTGLLVTVPNFDARTRPWYTGAIQKDGAAWSDVYILFTGQDMAISASRPVRDERQNLRGVVSVDIFLSHLSNFLRSLDIGKTGQSFIIERSGLLIASSTDEQPFITPSDEAAPPARLNVRESTIPLVRSAAKALTEQFGDYRSITGEQYFEFDLDDQRQFLQVSPFKKEEGIDWLIVTVIPEADFMAQITTNNRTTLGLMGVALVIAVVSGIFTARWITRPVLRLNASAQSLAKGEWDQTVTADEWIGEIGELTLSFNRMVGQLKQMMENLTTEIAERKQVEVALRDTSTRLSTLMENLQSGILFEDEARCVLYVNPCFCAMFNIPVPPEILVGMDCEEAARTSSVLFTNSASFAQNIAKIIAGQQPVIGEELSLIDGRTFERDYVPVKVNGHGRGHLWQYRDITTRKQAEKTLAELALRYQTLLQTANDGIHVLDEQGNVLEVNDTFCHMLGYPREELLRLNVADWDAQWSAEELATKIQLIFASPTIFETRHRRRDGEIRHVEINAVSAKLENHLCLYASARDITERKQAEAEREQLIGELKTALAQVKQLSGLLPICSSCKKIRNDQGYWQQVEVYIRDHSDVEFSHGICPDCIQRLYPEYYNDKNNR